MVNNKKKTVEELAKEMDTACALSSEISEIKVVMYGRVGSKEYLDNLLEWEEKQLINHPDWQVCKSFYDYGSGLKIQPKLKQLLDYVKNENIDALVVANGSRLIRRADLFIIFKRKWVY